MTDGAGSLCVISPHLDDAVFSCGERLLDAEPGATIVTVCGGRPGEALSNWDRAATGVATGAEAVALRLAEDDAAVAAVGGRAVRLPFLDRDYRDGALPPRRLAAAVGQALGPLRPDVVLAPLGLRHPDHVDVADACALLAGSTSGVRWCLYAEQPYATEWPAVLEARLVELRDRGLILDPLPPRPVTGRKAAAVAAYATQTALLRRMLDRFDESVGAPELLWAVTQPRPTSPVS